MGRNWFAKLTTTILCFGFKQSLIEHSLFIYKHKDVFCAFLVYVDGIVLTRNNLKKSEEIKCYLDANFKIQDLGNLKYFLGIKVENSSRGIFLCQRKYV